MFSCIFLFLIFLKFWFKFALQVDGNLATDVFFVEPPPNCIRTSLIKISVKRWEKKDTDYHSLKTASQNCSRETVRYFMC